MKRILTHIFFVLVLLFIGATNVLGQEVNTRSAARTKAKIEVEHLGKEKGTFTQKNIEEYRKDSLFSSVELDEGDSHVQDQQDSLVFATALVKVGGYLFSLYFILFAIKKRRTSYVASIQLFDYKYIVYRVLRI
ncbi:hypothetical protein [Myroides odoratus]|uniref:hypothetical protein n=1 Tax=Myroides odoratus TaxID=256 RepID=UPI00333F65B2